MIVSFPAACSWTITIITTDVKRTHGGKDAICMEFVVRIIIISNVSEYVQATTKNYMLIIGSSDHLLRVS